MTGQGKAGFFSGFKPVDSVLNSPPTYSINIENTDPIFFYCSAIGSCINYGMVGVINPNVTTSVDQQYQLALDSAYMLNPGEPFPPESPQPSNIPTNSATPGLSDSTNTDKKGLSTGAIAGIAIAGSSVVIIAGLLFFFWGRTKGLKDEVNRNAGTVRYPRPNNRSPPRMLEIGHNHPATTSGNGVGIYHQYQQTPLLPAHVVDSAYQQYNYNQGYSNAPGYSTSAPSYFNPQTPPSHAPPPPPPPSQQELQQQQNTYEYDINSSAGHPAHTVPPVQRQPRLSIDYALSQRSLGGAFELSPTRNDAGTLQSNHTRPPPTNNPSHNHTCSNANANNPDIVSLSPSQPYRITSPSHVLATAAATINRVEEKAPSYYESVYRPGPKHINGGKMGPMEIDGRAVTGETTTARMTEAKWEEVGEKTAGGGDVVYRG
ncbi:uncharacterized protein ALTATR162_LOCUS1766 [Alternaria atra]|uniref:Uncharacterized protein n=1 Tax=Alternaria atra TaxID=119953 RepID=A0A8J2HUK0_9PLEO|nr:uncharacterized protein ALTATR162_LOCUS1766 [Alternaria atra]CAG5145768.1 unnamed protein product [Alternaria atra]